MTAIYISLGFLLGGLAVGLFIWSRRSNWTADYASEIRSDDPPTDSAEKLFPDRTLQNMVLRYRQFLKSSWAEDTPDLIVSLWFDPASPKPVTHFDQTFLPVHDGLEDCLAALEESLREGSVNSTLPRNALIQQVWTFLYIPEKRKDLLVRSIFQPRGFHHLFYLLDEDGNAARILSDTSNLVEMLYTPFRVSYRTAMRSTLVEGDDPAAREEFHRVIAHDVSYGPPHAWLANIARRAEGEPEAIGRHLCVAQEFCANHLLTQIETAYLRPSEEEPPMLRLVARRLADECDNEGVMPFLLAQSFLALKNGRISRQLCERLLLQYPDHRHAAGLLRVIDQRERGAQT